MDYDERDDFYKPPSEKCVYYHKHNNTRIFTSAYEGIPETLLLNVLGWLLLLTLFAILRKRAWNYGRIALVQKSEDKWTQLFYGNMDEITGASSTDAESVASLDSTLYIDKGFCSWLTAVFRIKDQNILQKCGPDAVQYLAFQRHIIFYMGLITLISLAVVLPINFQGDLEGDEKTFGHTTVSNLRPSSPLLWTHVVLALLYLPLGIIVMRRFSLSMQLEEEDAHVSRTLMITNIPRAMCDKNDLHRHFSEAYPEIEVQDIQLAYDITQVSALDKKREKASQAKLYCENYLKSTGKRVDMRPYACGNACCCCDVFGCTMVDATDFYADEESRLSSQVDTEKNAALQRPLGVAFVTLVSLEAAERVHDDHAPSCKCSANPSSSSLSRQLEPHNWNVAFAPAPQDIYWENLSVSSNYWYIKAIIINLCLFIVLFFLTTPAIIVNMLDSIKFSEELQKMSPVLSEFLPTLLLWTVAALLPVLVSYSDQWLSHWTRSEQNHSVMRKTFLFLLFMVLLLPSLGLTSAQAFVEWALHPKNQTYRWECLFLPDKGAFFVSYVTTSAFIGTGLELIRFPELFVYATRLCLARSIAETPSVRRAILWEFPFGVQYAWMLLIFAMTIMYSLSCPLITPFGLTYMVLKHLVDRYNIYFAYGPSKISQSIHETAINCVIVSLVLLQMSFMSLSLLRQGLKDITLFSLAGFVLTIICVLAHIFLNCCKGFSPITYTRKSRRRPSENGLQPATPARHFVPSVLQPQTGLSRSAPISSGYGTRSTPVFETNSLPTSPTDPDDETLRFYQNLESRYEQV